jgi:hypothetical protein
VPDWLAVDGVSFVPLLASATAPPVRAFAFSEEFTGNAWPAPNTNGHAIVRDDRYKLIHRYGGGSHELFDLQNDPWEQSNLLAAPLTPAQLQRYNALLAEVARLRTPLARCTPFGSGCAGSAGTPAVACSAPPRLGTTIQLEVNGAPPSVFVVAAIGWSHTEQGGVTLPLSLTPFGSGPGCTQWFRLDATFATITTAAGSAAMSLAIPNTASLAELTLFHGGFVLDAMAPNNPLGIVTTNAQAVVLGL